MKKENHLDSKLKCHPPQVYHPLQDRTAPEKEGDGEGEENI